MKHGFSGKLRGFARGRSLALVFVLSAGLGACVPAAAPDPAALSWDEVTAAARGTEVVWAMWGGDERINAWVDGFVAQSLKDQYGLTLRRVPMDAAVFVNKLANEKAANRAPGSLDLLWINGENFKRAKAEGLLYGPFAERLPHFAYVNPAAVERDFGTPVEGYEAPYGRAQFVLDYDSARVSQAPASFAELEAWVRANPGRFTYPQIPDFTGSAFIRQAFYELGGGVQNFTQGWDQARFDAAAPALWAYLNRIKPFLWQQGRSYPAGKAELDALFERGEVDFNLSYHAGGAQGLVLAGRYPHTVRTAVFRGNSLSNIHYTAVPFNAPNKAGALVLANFLLSPAAQLSKNNPANWGDFTVLDLTRLPEAERQAFEDLDLGAATLPLDVLGANAVPEVSAEYVEALESGWESEVLAAP